MRYSKYFFIQMLSIIIFQFIFASAHATEFITNGFYSVYAHQALGEEKGNTHENDLDGFNVDFSEGTKLGLNIRSDFYKRWSFVGQMVAAGRSSGIAPGYRWAAMFDWMYLSHQWKKLETKFGRQLFPSWLVSEYVDVGYVYPWHRPPKQVYSILPFKSFEGLSLNYQTPFGRGKNFSLRAFAGNGRPTHEDLDEWFVTKIENLVGLMMGLGGVGWQFQFTVFQYDHIVQLTGGETPSGDYIPTSAKYEIPRVDAHSIGFKYDRDFVLYAEYGKVCCANDPTPAPSAANPAVLTRYFNNIYGYYVTVGQRFNKFLPHYTFSYSDYDIERQRGRTKTQSMGLNYSLATTVIFKIDYSLYEVGNGRGLLKTSGGPNTLIGGKAETVSMGIDAIF